MAEKQRRKSVYGAVAFVTSGGVKSTLWFDGSEAGKGPFTGVPQVRQYITEEVMVKHEELEFYVVCISEHNVARRKVVCDLKQIPLVGGDEVESAPAPTPITATMPKATEPIQPVVPAVPQPEPVAEEGNPDELHWGPDGSGVDDIPSEAPAFTLPTPIQFPGLPEAPAAPAPVADPALAATQELPAIFGHLQHIIEAPCTPLVYEVSGNYGCIRLSEQRDKRDMAAETLELINRTVTTDRKSVVELRSLLAPIKESHTALFDAINRAARQAILYSSGGEKCSVPFTIGDISLEVFDSGAISKMLASGATGSTPITMKL